jgi:hypothetical protein
VRSSAIPAEPPAAPGASWPDEVADVRALHEQTSNNATAASATDVLIRQFDLIRGTYGAGRRFGTRGRPPVFRRWTRAKNRWSTTRAVSAGPRAPWRRRPRSRSRARGRRDLTAQAAREHSVHKIRIIAAAMAVTTLGAFSGCGSSGSSGSPRPSDAAPNAPKTKTDSSGTLELVVDGKHVDAGTPSDCNINDYGGDPIFAFTSTATTIDEGLSVRLPPEPGPVGKREGNVILPDPSTSDSFQPTLDVTGSWSRSGDTARGHLEGTAKLASSITSSNPPPPTPFSIDFSCNVTEVHLPD